ncbi:MAG: hypothetical protein FWH07_03740 [Oscillospiraceae bacterium]|nr:hypothetical protein [Oscillospiraceae bacterium]
MRNKIRKMLSLSVVLAMVFSVAAVVTTTVSADASTAWFEFDKASGGWIVNDISRGAAGNDDSPYGHRVQFIPYDTEDDDLPIASGYEVLLKLPEFKADGETRWGFLDIATVRVTLTIDWANWPEEEHNNFEIATQNNIDSFAQHKEGGDIGVILEDFDEEADPEDFPNPVIMYAQPRMQRIIAGETIVAEYFKVMVTNWALAGGHPVPPVTALVHLIDHEGNVIVLTCPDCDGSPCVCECDICGNTIPECDCLCDICDNAPCVCCSICREPPSVCSGPANHGTAPPPPPTLPPQSTTTPASTTPSSSTTAPPTSATTRAATTTTARANTDTNPRTGVAIAFVPVVIAAGAVLATTKKRK